MNTRIWKTVLIALGFVAPLTAAPQAGDSDTDTTTAALKEQFRFGAAPPAAPTPEPSRLETGPEIVKMERIVVRESKLLKQTYQMLDEQKAALDAERFTLLHGGRMWEGRLAGMPAEAGVWPWQDLLKEDARFSEPSTLAKVEFVHMRW